jgi:hypothetical protein
MLLTGSFAHAASDSGSGKYETGYAEIVRIAADLHQALEPKFRCQVQPTPVLLDKMPVPFVQLTAPGGTGVVQVSTGFIDLLNYLSHAKAIDGVDRGFYKRSIASLAVQTGETGLPHLKPTGKESWSFNTMNRQMTQFNQMASALLGTAMAHHYLGHYRKYASRLVDPAGHTVPLESLLTSKEWREAVTAGAKNALACGFGMEGSRAYFDGLEKMPSRPAWAFRLLPDKAPVARIRLELLFAENDFFPTYDSLR